MAGFRLQLLGGVELSAHENGRTRRIGVSPKPLALLAYLAVAGADGSSVRRDVLLALFWPELPTDHARGALRQLLFQLRRALGDGAVRSERDTVAIVSDAISCDVVDFERSLARGDRLAATELYRGPLLAGFFIDGMSVALDEWVESARARLSRKAFDACTALADEAESAGNGVAAARWARAAAALAPDDEMAVRRLIQTLDRFGDRRGALCVAGDFARRLSEEFGAVPSAETRAVIAAVRVRQAAPDTVGADAVPTPSPAELSVSAAKIADAEPASEPAVARDLSRRRRSIFARRSALGAAFVVTVVVVALIGARRGGAASRPASSILGASPAVTIASSRARGLYDAGLDRFFAGDSHETARLMTAAIADDSSCAMCAYYAAMADAAFDDTASEHMLQLANRLADRVSEPERLLIHYRWADATNSSARRAVADSLVSRYPDWPEAQTAAAEADNVDGEWLTAADHLHRAIAAEPLPDSTSSGKCLPCETRYTLIATYSSADSVAAALRVSRELVREQPKSRLAWLDLSYTLVAAGRFDEARAAVDSGTRYATGTNDDVLEHAKIEIRAGNFATADRLLTTLAQTGNGNSRSDALWFLEISLRAQGRLHDALALAQGGLRRAESTSTQGLGGSIVSEAQAEFELGRYRRAAALFSGNATAPDAFSRSEQGRAARQRVWMLTHAGSALAAAGDTAQLAALADTVQEWGQKSGFGRDRRLHDYLRGLLWMARERPDSAAAAFGRATMSESEGFSRLDLERARALLALRRPREAIPMLRHPLSGSLEAGNFYATPTELQELLAHAYDAAGEPDSAVVYYKDVTDAWRAADPQFRTRLVDDRARLAADERHLIARRDGLAHASSPR